MKVNNEEGDYNADLEESACAMYALWCRSTQL